MSTIKPDVVQDLVVQLISGDAEVVNALLEAFGPPIQRRLRRRYHGVLPPGEIEDVVLFAVEKLWFRRERSIRPRLRLHLTFRTSASEFLGAPRSPF